MSPASTIDNRPIGVFDSGLGGLTVVSALRKSLPAEDIVYLGDTARVPYGDKSVECIIRFACQDFRFLAGKGVKTVVAACNTVSAVAMDKLRESFPEIPSLGVLEAGVESALKESPKRIAVLGTRATVNSDAYRRALHARNPSLIVESVACPLFVPLVEEGLTSHPLALGAFEHYLSRLKKSSPDVLLLGCTHYPLLKEALSSYLPGVKIVDSANACAERLKGFLAERGLTASAGNFSEERYYVTDLSSDFYSQASRFLGYKAGHVEKVVLEQPGA